MVCSPLKATIPFACQQKLSLDMLNKLFKLKSLFFSTNLTFLPSHVHLLLQLPGSRSQHAVSAVPWAPLPLPQVPLVCKCQQDLSNIAVNSPPQTPTPSPPYPTLPHQNQRKHIGRFPPPAETTNVDIRKLSYWSREQPTKGETNVYPCACTMEIWLKLSCLQLKIVHLFACQDRAYNSN